MRGVLEVNLRAFGDNVRKICAFLPKGTAYFSVIKANAYGIGLQPIARYIDQHLRKEVYGFAVANVNEAAKIRSVGSKLPILILSPVLPNEVGQLWATNATPLISSKAEIDQLERYAAKHNSEKAIHIAIDTGMGRAGVWYTKLDSFLDYIHLSGPHLKITGFATHYASIESDPQQTTEQHKRFLQVIPEDLKKTTLLHASSSFGIENYANGTNGVRIGALQYGYPEGHPLVKKLQLEPVASLKSCVVLIKNLPQGTKVGYDATYSLVRDTKVALLAIGYGDGIPRSLSNCGAVLILGYSCPMIGLLSMDQIAVDITDVPEVSIGDEAVFWGKQNGQMITIDEFSQWPYGNSRMSTCYLSERVDRKYTK